MKKLNIIFCSMTGVLAAPMSILSCVKSQQGLNHDSNKEQKDNEDRDDLELGLLSKKIEGATFFKNLKEVGIDGSHWDVNNTVNDVLNHISARLHEYDNDVNYLYLIGLDGKEHLKVAGNIIKIGYEIGRDKYNIDVNFTNVGSRPINTEDQKMTETNVKEKFVTGIKVNELYGWNTIHNALWYFENEQLQTKNDILEQANLTMTKNNNN